MSSPSQTAPGRRGFAAFFFAQLLSAFNDNFFKSAALVSMGKSLSRPLGLSGDSLFALGTALFVVPFLLFSASAGQLSDRFDKARLIRYIKLAEIAIMGIAALGFARADAALLVAALFAMGVHSAFLGPIKYAILPQLVAADRLVTANGLVVTSTFVAILGAMAYGGLLAFADGSTAQVGPIALALAVLGYLISLAIPELTPTAPALEVRRNPFASIPEVLRITSRTRSVFLSVLGISWFWFFGQALSTALPPFAVGAEHANPLVSGACLVAACAGIASGSLLCQWISGKNFELGLVPLGSLGMSLFTLDLFLVGAPAYEKLELLELTRLFAEGHVVRVLADLFAIGASGGFYVVPLYTLIEQRTPTEERSRVVAGNNILNALLIVAASLLLAALFEAQVSPETVFLLLALLNAAVAIYIYALLPEFLLRFVAWILSRVMYRLTVTGHERVPEQGGLVVVCNHVSFVDFLIIAGAIRRPVRFVMDHRIAATPVVSLIFKQGKTIPIAPERENRELMERAFARIAEELRAGEVVCIFPEGKLTANGEMNPFRPGIERIISETPVPVVPMALCGLWGSMFSRKERTWRRALPQRFRARLTLRIGDPVPAAQVTATDLQRRVTELKGDGPN